MGRIIPRSDKGYWETEKHSSLKEALAVVVMFVVVVVIVVEVVVVVVVVVVVAGCKCEYFR